MNYSILFKARRTSVFHTNGLPPNLFVVTMLGDFRLSPKGEKVVEAFCDDTPWNLTPLAWELLFTLNENGSAALSKLAGGNIAVLRLIRAGFIDEKVTLTPRGDALLRITLRKIKL